MVGRCRTTKYPPEDLASRGKKSVICRLRTVTETAIARAADRDERAQEKSSSGEMGASEKGDGQRESGS